MGRSIFLSWRKLDYLNFRPKWNFLNTTILWNSEQKFTENWLNCESWSFKLKHWLKMFRKIKLYFQNLINWISKFELQSNRWAWHQCRTWNDGLMKSHYQISYFKILFTFKQKFNKIDKSFSLLCSFDCFKSV